MAFVKLLAIVALAAIASATTSNFHEYRQAFKKDYASGKEMVKRQMIFEANLRKIDEHNAKHAKGEVTYTMGVNQFTDMTEAELESFNHGLPKLTQKMEEKFAAQSAVPKTLPAVTSRADKFSWRDKDYVVTSVKNQGGCGSCAAFACIAAIESCFNIKAEKKVVDDLSEQFIVDCANGHYYTDETGSWISSGCDGEWPQSNFDYVYSNHRGFVQTGASYPYEGALGECRDSDGGNYMADTVTGQEYYWRTQLNTEEELLKMVMKGPVVTTFGVNNPFYAYSGGVFAAESCCTSPEPQCTNGNNHAVAVVGFGTDENGVDYWEVKNSWGAGWGEQGFFKIARGKAMCGFGAQMITVPEC